MNSLDKKISELIFYLVEKLRGPEDLFDFTLLNLKMLEKGDEEVQKYLKRVVDNPGRACTVLEVVVLGLLCASRLCLSLDEKPEVEKIKEIKEILN